MDNYVNDPKQKTVRIKVVGVGGAGGNAINRMVEDHVKYVEFVAINTERKMLQLSKADRTIQIGKETTKGLSTGGVVELGEMAAKENADEIRRALEGADLVFIAAGMGGGTGTGAAPIVAEIAKSMDILTIGIVTKPFIFEGIRRMNQAKKGIEALKRYVDSMIVISNDQLLKTIDKKSTIIDAFKEADSTLKQGVVGITTLLNTAGLVNVDFNDIRSVMANTGMAHLGMCTATGERGIIDAIKGAAINSLSETKINGAKGVIINVSGGKELPLADVNDSITDLQDIIDENATVIWGTIVDERLKDKVVATIIATGVEDVY